MKTKTAMITIAGRPNVGKSTLTNFLVGEKIAIVSNKPQTTRNRICGIVTRDSTQFVFVDTPGFHRARTKLGDYMVNIAQESIADVDLTVLVVEPIASIGPQEEGLLQKIQASHCPAVLAINKIPLKGKYLRKLSPSVRLICLFATGYDNVDLSYFNEHGIPVCNVAAYGTTDVAQHTMALILDICRHISQHSASVHAGDWIQRGTWCYWLKSPVLLDGLTLGIIGFGAIGRRVGEMAHDFGMSVLANCLTPRNPPSYVPFSFASKKQVLQESDIISLHCPLTPETKGMINAEALSLMKNGAFLVNCARGGLLNEADCAAALRSGKLAGLGTDVLSTEPPSPDNPLLNSPNTIITPHIAWASVQSRQRIINLAAENIHRWLEGTPVNVVNTPREHPLEEGCGHARH